MSIGEKCAKFNFDEFFLSESDEDFCAIMIITPRQNICFSTEYHADGAEEIMEEVYNEDFDFNSDDYWPDLVNDYGCVAIQIVKRGFVIVNLPLVINQFQFNELFNFYRKLVEINGKLRKNGEEELEMHTNVFSNGNNLSFGRALIAYKKRIKEYDFPKEKMIKKSVKKV